MKKSFCIEIHAVWSYKERMQNKMKAQYVYAFISLCIRSLWNHTACSRRILLNTTYLFLNNVNVFTDRFCGSILSCNHGDTANRGVLTSAKPFGFRVYFNNAGDDNSGDRGFALNYRQEMC